MNTAPDSCSPRQRQWRLAGWINLAVAFIIVLIQALVCQYTDSHEALWKSLLWASGANFGVGFFGLWKGQQKIAAL